MKDTFHLIGMLYLAAMKSSIKTIEDLQLSMQGGLETGPLQLEVTWYKIQNIGEQNNVPDSKTKQNTIN